jgi:CBS domain-containing protein
VNKVRDAMIADPPVLEASASAQQAGELFDRPEVRAVLVCEDGRLMGIVTRKTLVREVVARGRDPRGTLLGELAEDPMFTLDPDTELDDAFRGLEERDLDRAPVVEPDGRLVGVLSRAVVQRRLAEDEPPEETEA